MGHQRNCLWSFFVYLVTLALFLAGFGSDYWLFNDEAGIRRGLWQQCTRDAYSWRCSATSLSDQKSWFQATAALMIMALMIGLAAGATRIFLPISSGLDITAGLFTLIAITVFGVEINSIGMSSHLHWSFGLATTSGILFTINGTVLAILTFKRGCDMTSQLPCQTSTEA